MIHIKLFCCGFFLRHKPGGGRATWAERGCACSVRPGTVERASAVVSETTGKPPTPDKVARFVAKTLWKNHQI